MIKNIDLPGKDETTLCLDVPSALDLSRVWLCGVSISRPEGSVRVSDVGVGVTVGAVEEIGVRAEVRDRGTVRKSRSLYGAHEKVEGPFEEGVAWDHMRGVGRLESTQ